MINKHWFAQLPIKNIERFYPVSGGFMNKSYCIETPDDKYFIKIQPGKGKPFFKYEVDGLNLLDRAVTVPKIVSYGQVGHDGYLILKWTDFIDFNAGDQYRLGQAVAKMHRIHRDRFGFDYSFYLGRIFKNNSWQDNWIKFYINQRLDPEVKILKHDGIWNSFRETHYQRMRRAFIDYYSNPEHKVVPSLLHGDLWEGNCGFLSPEKPVLIDPNVIFGDRELDLGSASLDSPHNDFNREFYKGYNSIYPLKPGLKKRLPWYQFNYILNNVITFRTESHTPLGIDDVLKQF